MSLYLTSDEITETNLNTRTSFSNYINQDFYKGNDFNLKLKELFFDTKFPTIANLGTPHAVTLISGHEHKLREFPKNIRDISTFRNLFVKGHGVSEKAFMRVHKEVVSNTSFSDVDFTSVIEIHPRLNLAFSLVYLRDIKLSSKAQVVDILNRFLFPLHARKPISYTSGRVEIDSKLPIFLSESILKLLGFYKDEISDEKMSLKVPLKEEFNHVIDFESDEQIVYPDDLARMEMESKFYSNYRTLISLKPKGTIQIKFKIGNEEQNSSILFDLDVFNQNNDEAFNYEELIDAINYLLLNDFLNIIKHRVLNLKITFTEEDETDLEDLLKYLKYHRKELGFDSWGGLITLHRQGKKLLVKEFHTVQNKQHMERFAQKIQSITGSPLVKQAFNDIFFMSSIDNISFNSTLATLFGLNSEVHDFTLNFDAKGIFKGEQELNYFKCVQIELLNSFTRNAPFFLHLMILTKKINGDSQIISPINLFRSEQENFYFFKKRIKYCAIEDIDLHVNSPKLIFVTCNFVQHSLFGSSQKKILNFFPFKNSNGHVLCHKFKNPIILNKIIEPQFHISLLDENMKTLKADIGIPTLLTLQKSARENMFPVIVYSSDPINLRLYNDNRSNSFKNQLSFPLYFSNRKDWSVSLRSIAFPKVKNIYPSFCNLSLTKPDSKDMIQVSVQSSYTTEIEPLLALINSSIESALKGQSQIPIFSFVDNKVNLNTNGYDCHLEPDILKLLGLSLSFPHEQVTYEAGLMLKGVASPNLFMFQPQELLVLSNIVEEAFYAQNRPQILRVVPVPNQLKSNGYNFVEFEDHDNVAVSVDRINDIEIKIVTRKGDPVSFVDQDDVKIQLEFKKFST